MNAPSKCGSVDQRLLGHGRGLAGVHRNVKACTATCDTCCLGCGWTKHEMGGSQTAPPCLLVLLTRSYPDQLAAGGEAPTIALRVGPGGLAVCCNEVSVEKGAGLEVFDSSRRRLGRAHGQWSTVSGASVHGQLLPLHAA